MNEKGLFYAFCEILIDKTPVALRRIFIHLWNARFAEWKNTPESGILFAHGPHSTYYTTSIGSGKIQEASKVVQELDQDPTVKKGSRVKLVRSDDQAEFFSTVSESEWKEAKGIGQIKLKDKLFPKNSDGPPSKYQVEVFASQIYDVNFPPRAAASNDGAKKRVLAGNTEDWDLTLVLWALLNSAYELCGNTTDQQMLALKRTLENKDKDQLGVRNVRNCAFGHVQRASMPWQDFVKSVERLLAAMDAIDDVLDLREAADGCRATLEGDIVRALSECSGPEALQQETARTQLEMYQSQLKQWEELEAKRRFTVHSSGDGGFTAGQNTAPVTINNYYYSGHTSDPSRGESGDGTQGGGRGEGRGAAAVDGGPGDVQNGPTVARVERSELDAMAIGSFEKKRKYLKIWGPRHYQLFWGELVYGSMDKSGSLNQKPNSPLKFNPPFTMVHARDHAIHVIRMLSTFKCADG